MKKIILFGLLLALGTILYAQSRGTPSTLRVKIDATGALAVSSAAITNPVTTVVFNNARLAIDANGYLVVTDGSGAGFAPANATYVTRSANSTLTNEFSLGTLTSAALINTVAGSTGTLSAYAGVTCTNSVLTAFSAILAGTCTVSPQLTNVTTTGIHFIADGTSSAPSLALTSSNGVGLYKISVNLGYVNGANGRFVIGTTADASTSSRPGLLFCPLNTCGVGYNLIANGAATSGTNISNVPLSMYMDSGTFTGGIYFGNSTTGPLVFFTGGLTIGTHDRWSILTTGHLVAPNDNTFDIGASGATRPRTGYFGTSIITPVGTFATSVDTATVTATTSVKNSNSTNGQAITALQTLTELTTIAAAATTDTTIQMPANSVVLAVAVRVTTVIPTATNFTVGDSGSAARFSTAAVSSAAGSTDPGTKAGAYYNASTLSIRITPDMTPANNSGRVRVVIYYYTVTPPTS